MRSFSFSRQRKKEEENLSLFLFSFLFSHRNKNKPLPLGELLGELAHGLERLDVGLGCFCCSIRGERFFSTKRGVEREHQEKKGSVSGERKKTNGLFLVFHHTPRASLSSSSARASALALGLSEACASKSGGGEEKAERSQGPESNDGKKSKTAFAAKRSRRDRKKSFLSPSSYYLLRTGP